MKKIINAVLLSIIAITLSACGGDSASGDQGTPTAPIDLGAYPVSNHGGTVGIAVDSSSGSYYKITSGMNAGGSYTVTLTNTTGNVVLRVFDASNYDFFQILCQDLNIIKGDRTCVLDDISNPKPLNAALYLQVVNVDPSNASFNISVN